MATWKLIRGLLPALVFTWFALAQSARAAFHEPVNAPLNASTGHSAFSVGIGDLGGAPGVVWEEFSPAELEGHKIEQLVQYPIDFKLNAVLPVKPFEVPRRTGRR